MVVPTTLARAAVRTLHVAGAARARAELAAGKVGQWAAHQNPSMASGNSNVIAGLDAYIAEAARDGRAHLRFDATSVVRLPSRAIEARVDVVLDDRGDVAGRVVLWDGPDFDPADAPVMAAVYAKALEQLYPGRVITTIGIWQARRQRFEEVDFASAVAQLPAADTVAARV